jgi:hypothetical protein
MTNQIMVKMVLDAWHSRVKEATDLFDKLSDEQLHHEVSLNRNRGIYLLGHLAAVHDRMLPLLNLGEQLYPHLADSYINSPDKSSTQTLPANELRKFWKNINSTLADHFNNLQADDWFQKHNSVSTEDFIKEPHRNKLNVLISRTNHLSYHLGQLALLKSQ